MPLQNNQGHRRDLNLSETPNDRIALSNLGGTGIGDDLSRLVNNLRNTSKVSFHTIEEGYFSFGDDINVGISSLRCIEATRTTSLGVLEGVSKITIHSSRSYLLRIGDLIKIENVTGTGKFTDGQGNLTETDTTVGVDIFEGDFSVTAINRDENQFECIKTGFTASIRDQNVSGSNLIIRGRDVFTYTNDDLVTFDKDVTVVVLNGSTPITNVTFTKGTPYYVCDSNGLDRFKLSTRPSFDAAGISPVVIKHGGSDSGYTGLVTSFSPDDDFGIIRSEPVHHENLVDFIAPDIQDPGFSYGSGTISEQMDSIQNSNETSQYFIGKKYKGNTNTTTTDQIKTEGSITLNDPKKDMTSSNVVTSYTTGAGMFIEGTRAFSTDNNPWSDKASNTTANSLETESDEVSIGELYFGDHTNGPIITGPGFDGTHASDTLTGVRSLTVGTVVPTDFSHKIPVKIENADGNVETYYLLLTRNTDNTSSLP